MSTDYGTGGFFIWHETQ